jgi:hypothetical protein
VLAGALADRVRALAGDDGGAGLLASDGPLVSDAVARAVAAWPAGAAPPVRLPVAGRWSLAAEDAHADAVGRVALWRGGTRVADDARAVGLAYARMARPVGLALLEVDAAGEFGAFADGPALRDRLLDPATPATVAAVDAGDGGAPWLVVTLAALVATRRLAVVLPAGATLAEVARDGSALEVLLRHHAGPVVCHAVG